MATLRTATPATSAMRSVLPRFVTPAEIAQLPETTIFLLMEPRFVVGTSAVSQVANLARPELPFTQANAANQPAMVFDASLGRNTLTFGSDRNDHMVTAATVNYAAAWSILTVYKPNALGVVQNILGEYDGVVSLQNGVQLNGDNLFRSKVSNAQVTGAPTAVSGSRYAVIGAYGGSGRVKQKTLGGAVLTGGADVTTAPTTTAIKLGHQTFGLNGSVDMVAMFSVDILAPAQADLLSRVETMLKQYYGAAVVGGA